MLAEEAVTCTVSVRLAIEISVRYGREYSNRTRDHVLSEHY